MSHNLQRLLLVAKKSTFAPVEARDMRSKKMNVETDSAESEGTDERFQRGHTHLLYTRVGTVTVRRQDIRNFGAAFD